MLNTMPSFSHPAEWIEDGYLYGYRRTLDKDTIEYSVFTCVCHSRGPHRGIRNQLGHVLFPEGDANHRSQVMMIDDHHK